MKDNYIQAKEADTSIPITDGFTTYTYTYTDDRFYFYTSPHGQIRVLEEDAPLLLEGNKYKIIPYIRIPVSPQ